MDRHILVILINTLNPLILCSGKHKLKLKSGKGKKQIIRIKRTESYMQQTASLTNLQGQIERITFNSEETGYTVAKVKVYGRKELVTVIGNMV